MKKIALFILCFCFLISTISFANYCSNDWPNTIHWSSNNPKSSEPPTYNYPGEPYYATHQYNSYYGTPNYTTNNFDCKSISIPTPQVVYDNDGIIPIGNFVERLGGVYFCFLNGVFARNTWLKTKGKWYYFDMSSVMMKGFVKINGLTYYFNSDGSMATGTTIINGQTHYFDATGAMVF